jgi:crossover junction endodeoxyribonuclease RuvC
MNAKPVALKIVAFDPGFERLGAAVVEKAGGKEALVHSECIRTDAKTPFPDRLALLGKAAESLIKKHKPGAVALEKIYFEKNAKTAMQVAAVVGVLAYVAAKNGLPVYEYTPLEVKAATTGYGRSDKAAVAAMVFKLLGIKALPAGRQGLDDELDAIAIGLTCLASAKYPQRAHQK